MKNLYLTKCLILRNIKNIKFVLFINVVIKKKIRTNLYLTILNNHGKKNLNINIIFKNIYLLPRLGPKGGFCRLNC